MKKTLIAVAALSAMAASAMAANVTVYGVVDTGLHYQHTKAEEFSSGNPTKSASVNKFDMASGQNSGSRVGFKGVEDLGNGAKVGFVLENGFSSDDGKLGNGGRLFGREANLYVTTDFGTLSFGRVGALTSGAGSYNLMKYTPFSSGWGKTTGAKSAFWLGDRDRMDNTITYVTPSFAGVKAYAQYSFERDGQEEAGNERQNDRYAAFGLTFNQGAFSTALIVDSVLYQYGATNHKDSLGVTWGASYDFSVVKVFAQAQYGKHENAIGLKTSFGNNGKSGDEDYFEVLSDEGFKGYGITLGVTAPVAGGTLYAQANYLDSKTCENVTGKESTGTKAGDKYGTKAFDPFGVKVKNWGAAVGYEYTFSKRTKVYTYASYNQLKATDKTDSADGLKTKQTEIGFGLVHTF